MRYIICLPLLLLFVTSCGQSKNALPEDVVKSIGKRIVQGTNPSIAIGVIDKSGPHYYNFGQKSDSGSAVDEHTIYEIGSISKVFTAILLAQQVNEGKLKLDDPIRNYLPARR